MSHNSTKMSFFIMLLSVPLSGVGVDICAPSLPAIASAFHADHHLVEWTITCYMLGFGLAQFSIGPVSDCMGRKPLIMFGCITYLFSIVGILLVNSIIWLIILRIIQGICAAIFSVPIRAITADIFSGDEFMKAINGLTLAWGLGPILAPAIGGYLQSWLGWQANFWFMFGYGLIILIAVLVFFKETNLNQQKFSPTLFRKIYGAILTHSLFGKLTLLAGFFYAFIIVFHIKAPFIVEHSLGLTAIDYGHLAFLMGGGWFLGNFVSRHKGQFSIQNNTTYLLLLVVFFTLLMAILTYFFATNSWTMACPVVACTFIVSFCFPFYTAKAIVPSMSRQ